jgi:hypothetical protein
VVENTVRAGVLLVGSAASALGISLLLLVLAVLTDNRMAIPGAAIATAGYSVLGFFTLRGAAWARWTLVALVLLTAAICLLFAFVDLGGPKPRLAFTPELAIAALVYTMIAAGAVVRPGRVWRC